MELLALILLGGLFALWVSNRDLKRRVDWLEQRLETGTAPGQPIGTWPPAVPAAETEPPRPTEPAEPEVPFTVGYTPPPPRPQVESTPAPVVAAEPVEAVRQEEETLGGLFERLVAGRLLIWLGGIALVVAAVFLIRYSIEIGLVTPRLRMIAAALFGLALLGAGEYARAGKLLSDDPRFAQVFVGAGLAVLYLTTYGSHVLHALIDSPTASALMVAVTAAALVLSLRHGAPAAVMGLTGGFLTPLLVGDPQAGAVPLLGYLALLDFVIFVIAWRRGWTWLAAAAVVLSFVWSAYLLFQPPDDALAAGAFIILLALAASLVRPGEGRELGLTQPLAVGLVQLAILVGRTDLGVTAWIQFAVLSLASLALGAFRREYRAAPPIALALGLVLLLGKVETVDPNVPAAAVGIAAIFGLGGLFLTVWRPSLLWTAIAAAGLSAPALIVRAARPELLDRTAWGGIMLGLAVVAALLAWLKRGCASKEAPADLSLFVAGAAVAWLAGAAVWDLLPADYVAAGWLAVAVALALAARRLDDLALTTVSAITAAVAVARAVWMVPDLSTAAITALVGDPVLATDLPSAREAALALALPAGLLVALRMALPPLPIGARRVLPAVAGLFAVSAAYVWFKQAFGLSSDEDFVARGLIERTIFTQALFVGGFLLGGGMIRVPRVERDMQRIAGTMLTAFAAVRLIWFDMIVHNPAWYDQWVGTLPVLNLISAEYLLGALWLYLARRRADQATRSGFWLAAFFAALVAGTMLLVRQAFQGAILTGPDMPIAEFYAYSLAGLVVSIGLLVAGIRLPDKALRLAGLILLTGTILKVFLIDAGELEGIWRILSFLGLGVALIGIGRLYGPVLKAERRDED